VDSVAALVGANIRVVREAKGWTLERLALEVRTSHSHIDRLELGKQAPNVRTLAKLARALDTSIDRLVEGVLPEDES
jgi:transcriptional regulator with XRE-family HTH domain